MTSLPERRNVVALIEDAIKGGARKSEACSLVGLSVRTLQRWQSSAVILPDLRTLSVRGEPKNKLTAAERQRVVDICHQPEFAQLAPSQIVPILADRGVYIASESSFYRILKSAGLLHHRGRAKPKGYREKPTSHTAFAANQVWSWDISYMPSNVIGQHFYLYMIEDIYSRKIVGWEVHERECGEYAAQLLERSVWAERCVKSSLVLHSDNGSPMKSLTLQAKMYDLGVLSSRSRPRVSNDNPYSESLFRTVKYHPRWPSEGFKSINAARGWVQRFVAWYNNEHRHSRIKFVTPAQRHSGKDKAILKKRQELYQLQKMQKPQRWANSIRNWAPEGPVELNPEKPKIAA